MFFLRRYFGILWNSHDECQKSCEKFQPQLFSQNFFFVYVFYSWLFFAGNAFRIAYASQIQDEHYTPKEKSYPAFRTSRSADSLLSPDVLNGTPEDFGIGNSKISWKRIFQDIVLFEFFRQIELRKLKIMFCLLFRFGRTRLRNPRFQSIIQIEAFGANI